MRNDQVTCSRTFKAWGTQLVLKKGLSPIGFLQQKLPVDLLCALKSCAVIPRYDTPKHSMITNDWKVCLYESTYVREK